MSKKFSRKLRTFKEWMLPFSTAWELLLDIPFPKGLKSQHDDVENSSVLISFPLVGAFLGISGYIIARFLLAFLDNFAASVIFSILFAAFLEFITKCRNLSIFSSFIENRFGGISTYDSFMNLNDNFNSQRSPVGTISIILLFIFRVFCFAALVYHGCAFWIITVLTADFTVQAHLAAGPDIKSSQPLLEVEEKSVYQMWFTAAAVIFISSFPNFSSTVIAVAVSFIFAFLFRKYCLEILEGVSGKITGFAGYAIEIIMLLAGIVLLVKS